MTTAKRVGPSMSATCRILRHYFDGVAESRMELARHVGPHGSLKYGYNTIDRCLVAGLVKLDPDHPKRAPRSSGAVVLTEYGERVARDSSAV
jgi:hypothetical protein